MTGALAAASTICASIKGQISEVEAQQWHDAKVGIAHTRWAKVDNSASSETHVCVFNIIVKVPSGCPQCVQANAQPDQGDPFRCARRQLR